MLTGSDSQASGRLSQSLDKSVVNFFKNNSATAGRAFLTLKAEGGVHHTNDGFIEVGIAIDDDGVFATHFNDAAFDVMLTRLQNARFLKNVKTDFT